MPEKRVRGYNNISNADGRVSVVGHESSIADSRSATHQQAVKSRENRERYEGRKRTRKASGAARTLQIVVPRGGAVRQMAPAKSNLH